MEKPQTSKENYHVIQESHYWVYIQRKGNQYAEEIGICTPMFISDFSQWPRYRINPGVCEQMDNKNVMHTHTMEYYSSMEKNEILSFMAM